MIASPPSKTNYLRNERLKAERDRQMAVTMRNLRRMLIVAAILVVCAAAAFWYYGCSLSDGCTATPVAQLQQGSVTDLVPAA